jgi:hypothetical protein
MLLNHIRGSLSFQDLKMVRGIVASTFREGASLHRLLKIDNSLKIFKKKHLHIKCLTV